MTTGVSLEGYTNIFHGGWLKKDEKGLDVQIVTKDLEMHSICEEDREHYEELYTDPNTMKMFTDNEERIAKGLEQWKKEQMTTVATNVDKWIGRWKKGIPFSAFAIYAKKTKSFVGHGIAGFGDKPGKSEIAIILGPKYQDQLLGTQVMEVAMDAWLPYLNKEGYKTGSQEAGWKVVERLTATAREDHEASKSLLTGYGFKPTSMVTKWGCKRGVYERDIVMKA